MTTTKYSRTNTELEENECLTQVAVAALHSIPNKTKTDTQLARHQDVTIDLGNRPDDSELAAAIAAKFNVPYHVAFEWLGNFGDGAV